MKKVILTCTALLILASLTGCKSGITDNEYEDTTLYLCSEEANPSNLFLVRKQGKYAFLMMDESDSIINNQWFDDAHHYSHGLWAVKLNEKWGFVDTTGNIVIPTKFDSVLVYEEEGDEVFSEYGLGHVYLKSKGWICIDTTGTEVSDIYTDNR